MSAPKSKSTKIMGVSHHFLLCISMSMSSLTKLLDFSSFTSFSKSSVFLFVIINRCLKLSKVLLIVVGLPNGLPISFFVW